MGGLTVFNNNNNNNNNNLNIFIQGCSISFKKKLLSMQVLCFPYRNRAARVEDYIETLKNVHNTFGLPYPAVSQQSLSAPLSPKSDTRHGRYNLSYSILVSHAAICDETKTAA